MSGKKKRRPKYHRDPMASLILLGRATMGSANDAGRQAVVRTMFDRLRGGEGEPADFDKVCMALNVAGVRAHEIDSDILKRTLSDGHSAMAECRRRYVESGRFGFTGPEIVAMLDALDAYEAIEQASSDLQMEQAWNTAKRSLELQKGNV